MRVSNPGDFHDYSRGRSSRQSRSNLYQRCRGLVRTFPVFRLPGITGQILHVEFSPSACAESFRLKRQSAQPGRHRLLVVLSVVLWRRLASASESKSRDREIQLCTEKCLL